MDSLHTNEPSPVARGINLAQFLKLRGAAETGGQAKLLIQDGQVAVNGKVETRRGRKLQPGDRVRLGREEFVV